ncbi:DUF3598 family protein [Leptothoe sp. PORK10 BA2]|uniref:DUF3598 family protein n=1 Tax=Leptothoe sp. PORK10 BA2 TaxID=3110254 RepID=UPI002B221783|nr:DUF3598 family protein [Leptothoe sp. PORK10 BA2]MEA5462444.1 DUF3598 family protein [Leptothoe sp. PORK10 BA2]
MTDFSGVAIDHLWTTEQWTYIRKNIGQWQGLFIQLSPSATQVSSTPSVLTLEEDRLDQHMTLVLTRTPQGQPSQTMERDLGYPGAAPYICFFPTGAFSQGPVVRRPWSSFGSEFSLLAGNRRLRLVQLYNGTATGEHILDYVTLIPEYRLPTAATAAATATIGAAALSMAPPQIPLMMDRVLGTWQGNSLYLPATMDRPQIGSSYWQAKRLGDELQVSWGSGAITPGQTESTTGRFTPINSHCWQAVGSPLQFWLLPGDASCTVYPQLPQQSGARLEFCWYLSPRQRQRLVRDYGTDGNWLGTSLMLETRL